MEHMIYFTSAVVISGLVYLGHRIIRVINRMEAEKFMCWYCHQWFPMAEQDRQGQYFYCSRHGARRGQCLSS